MSFLFCVTCSTNIIRHEKLGQLRCFESTDTMSSKLDNKGGHLSKCICKSDTREKKKKLTNFVRMFFFSFFVKMYRIILRLILNFQLSYYFIQLNYEKVREFLKKIKKLLFCKTRQDNKGIPPGNPT